MPDESCRACGEELVNHVLCPECRKATQKKCKVCDNVTTRQPHELCTNGSSYNDKTSSVEVLQNRLPKTRKYPIRFPLLTFGVVAIFFIGFITASYINMPSGISNEAQATNANNTAMRIVTNFDDESEKSYDNCLAYGSGESVTITCPKVNGSVYKAILEMPKGLANNFSESVFSIRGMSLIENPDGSVTLQYLHKEFRTNFFGN